MYEVIGSNTSRAFRVLWMLEELGEPYEHQPEGTHSDLVTSLNPSGKIPVFKDGDAVITDSTAIITYLADKHQKFTAPAGTIKRAQQDAMTHLIIDEIDAVLWTATRHSFTLPQEHRVDGVRATAKWEFARNIAFLAERFKGPFVMGDEFTIPDILLTHCLNWAYGAKFLVEDAALLEYAKAMRQREAFVRAKG